MLVCWSGNSTVCSVCWLVTVCWHPLLVGVSCTIHACRMFISNECISVIMDTPENLSLLIALAMSRPATIHFCTIRYVSLYSCHNTIHDTIRYITTKQEGYCVVSSLWAEKSGQLTLRLLCLPS